MCYFLNPLKQLICTVLTTGIVVTTVHLVRHKNMVTILEVYLKRYKDKDQQDKIKDVFFFYLCAIIRMT